MVSSSNQSRVDNLFGAFAVTCEDAFAKYLRQIISSLDDERIAVSSDESFMRGIEGDLVSAQQAYKFRLQILVDVAFYSTTGQNNKISHTMKPVLRRCVELYALAQLKLTLNQDKTRQSYSQAAFDSSSWESAKSYLQQSNGLDETIADALLNLL